MAVMGAALPTPEATAPVAPPGPWLVRLRRGRRAACAATAAVVTLAFTAACTRGERSDSALAGDSGDAVAAEAAGDLDPSFGDSVSGGAPQLRFVNAVMQPNKLDVRFGETTSGISAAAGTVTPYRAFAAGDLHVALLAAVDSSSRRDSQRIDSSAVAPSAVAPPRTYSRISGVPRAGDTLAVRRETLREGRRYTVIGMPSDDGEGVIVRVVSDNWLPDPAVAQVRVIHAAPLAGQFDLVLVGTNSSVFEDVSFANATGFQRLAPAASQRLALRQNSRPERLFTVPAITRLDAGRAYTIVITGRRDAWDVLTLTDDTRIARTVGSRRALDDAGRGGVPPRLHQRS